MASIQTRPPHEVNPALPENLVWTQFPWDPKFLEDPEWYDTFGRDKFEQRGVWNISSPEEQTSIVNKLLEAFPS
jgi:hypothetical protein